MAGLNDVVLEWIDGAAKAARKARHDPSDVHALHRFRTNTRRLIVYAKIIEKACDAPAKMRKRLRRALRATGACRDGHVKALWLDDYVRRSGSQDTGAKVLGKALARSGASAPETRWWRKVQRLLRKTRHAVEAGSLENSESRAAQNMAVKREWRRLERRLRRLDRTCDHSTLHAARIAAKKLRYLLETMRRVPRGMPSPSVLRGLQGALGEAHDRDVIAAGVAAAERAEKLGLPARQALRQLKRERDARLSCARLCWEPLLDKRKENVYE